MKMAEKKRLVGFGFFVAVLLWLTWISTEVYIVGLHIGTTGTRVIHGATILFWGLFIFSWFSGELTRHRYSKLLYRICNGVFGMMFYLFLGSVLLSILLALLPTVHMAVVLGVVGLSLVLGIVGLWQARILSTTVYEITLPRAPHTWHEKRAVFISDTHFGLMNHKNFSDMVVENILKLNPDMVFHGGDFYDGPSIDTDPITASWKKLTEKVPVFYTSGNHELYGPYEAFIQSIRDAGITVLLDEKTVHEGVQIAGITYRGKHQHQAAAEAIKKLKLDQEIASILINHPPTFHQSAYASNTTLMLSGHTHRGQFSPLGIITWLIYKRFNYGLNVVENMTAVTSRGVGTAGPPMRLFNTPELVVITFKTKEFQETN